MYPTGVLSRYNLNFVHHIEHTHCACERPHVTYSRTLRMTSLNCVFEFVTGRTTEMSAEPRQTALYANDLRRRVVWQHIAVELPFRNIAKNLSMSVGTAYDIFKRFHDTGEVDPKPTTTCRRESLYKLDSHHRLCVIGLIIASPDLHLPELVSEVRRYSVYETTGIIVHVSTICRLLAEHGFIRTKIQHVALQRRMEWRATFMANVFRRYVRMG